MAVGGVIAGLAFVCAGILEYGLQQSYPPLPPNHEGQIILINTLPCDLRIEAEEKSISLPNSQTLTLTNIPVDHETVQNFEIISPNSCGSALAGRNHAKAAVTLHEKDVPISYPFYGFILIFLVDENRFGCRRFGKIENVYISFRGSEQGLERPTEDTVSQFQQRATAVRAAPL